MTNEEMSYYYTKSTKNSKRYYARIAGLVLSLVGFVVLLAVTLPLVISYATLEQVYASQNIEAPVPRTSILTTERMKDILSATIDSVQQVDYSNAKTWFPSLEINPTKPRVDSYTLSIPTIGIEDATVSTVDYDVGRHLINYGGTAVPPDRGNAVIFGHSTLPQLFNQTDYKTIFAKLHLLKTGDEIQVAIDGESHTYKIFAIDIVSPDDFSPLMQQYDDSYLTLITCTPPGTTWERLIVKTRLVK